MFPLMLLSQRLRRNTQYVKCLLFTLKLVVMGPSSGLTVKKKKNQLRFHVSDVEESYPGRADMKVVIIKLGLYNNITPAREDI